MEFTPTLAITTPSEVDPYGLERLSLSYETANDLNWFDKLLLPPGTIRVNRASDIVADIRKRIGGSYSPQGEGTCNCVEKLLIAGHGSPGEVQFADVSFNAGILQQQRGITRGRKNTNPRKDLDFLQRLAKYLCEGATVEFFVCQAGNGTAGSNLAKELYKIFGADKYIDLSTGDVGFMGGGLEWQAPPSTK